MKKTILLIFLIAGLCGACKDKEATMRPSNDKEIIAMEKFDIKKYEKEQSLRPQLPLRSEPYVEYEYEETPKPNININEEKLPAKSDAINIDMFEGDDYYAQNECPQSKNDIDCVQKTFYKDTLSLKSKFHYLRNGASIGIWEYFDASGKKIKEENLDEGYEILWPDVEKILKENKFNISDIVGVYKSKGNWSVRFIARDIGKKTISESLLIDGKTGAIIEKQTEEIKIRF
jgi:hypothetical protein